MKHFTVKVNIDILSNRCFYFSHYNSFCGLGPLQNLDLSMVEMKHFTIRDAVHIFKIISFDKASLAFERLKTVKTDTLCLFADYYQSMFIMDFLIYCAVSDLTTAPRILISIVKYLGKNNTFTTQLVEFLADLLNTSYSDIFDMIEKRDENDHIHYRTHVLTSNIRSRDRQNKNNGPFPAIRCLYCQDFIIVRSDSSFKKLPCCQAIVHPDCPAYKSVYAVNEEKCPQCGNIFKGDHVKSSRNTLFTMYKQQQSASYQHLLVKHVLFPKTPFETFSATEIQQSNISEKYQV